MAHWKTSYCMRNAKKRNCKKVSDAFDLYLNKYRKNYPEKYEFNTAEIISIVNAAGGVCSIAHPHAINNAENIPKLVKETGIEVVENKKIYKDDKEFISMGLIKTAGSDFLRSGKNSYLGKNNLSEELFILFKCKKNIKWENKWKF